MSNCAAGQDKSRAFFIDSDVATNAGTAIPSNTIDPDGLGAVFNTLSVINDKDQDVKITFSDDKGNTGEFIVPVSIRGFTKNLKYGKFIPSSFVVISIGPSAAEGRLTFNFGN